MHVYDRSNRQVEAQILNHDLMLGIKKPLAPKLKLRYRVHPLWVRDPKSAQFVHTLVQTQNA